MNTSRNQLPACFKKVPIENRILDFGSGRFSKTKDYARSLNCEYHGYDPYWLDESINTQSLLKTYDYIVIANTLNVIVEVEVHQLIYQLCKMLLNENGVVIIQVYEGDSSTKGSVTRDGYQQNKKLNFYEECLYSSDHLKIHYGRK